MLSGTFAHCAGVRIDFASLIACVACFLPSAIEGWTFANTVIGSGFLTVVSASMLATLSMRESALLLNASPELWSFAILARVRESNTPGVKLTKNFATL